MRTRRHRWLLTGVLFAVACEPEPRLPEHPRATTTAAAPPAPLPDELVLPEGDGARAPWLETTVAEPQTLRPLFADRNVVSHGEHGAIIETRPGQFFAAHDADGVLGPLAVPADTRFVRLDGKGRVFAATSAGKLFVAADAKAATSAKGFVEVDGVPGAVAWDAGNDLVAAAKGPSVVLSKDGGKTWSTSTPGKDASSPALDEVLLRGDGVLGAHDVDGGIFTSADRGKTWHRFSVRSPMLQQHGALIFVGLPDCPIMLSRDGISWDGDPPKVSALLAGRGDWSRLLETSTELVAHPARPMITASEPRPPPRPARPYVGTGTGMCTASATGVASTPAVTRADACAGAFCLERAYGDAPVGATRIEVFEDGLCDPAEAETGTDKCKPGARLTRQPTIAVGDPVAKTVRAVALPEGCRVAQVFQAAGAALVLCANEVASKGSPSRAGKTVAASSTGVYMLDARGEFHAEGTLGTSADAFARIATASDGTLLLHCKRDRLGCKSWVRSPRALGDPSAWRIVDLPHSVLYHPWLGGTVLAFAVQTEDAFSLLLDRPHAPPALLAKEIVVANIGRIQGVSLEHARVTLLTTQGEVARRLRVTAGGALAPL